MNVTVPIRQRLTYNEYVALEDQSETRYEFHDGEVVAMAGTTLRHNRLVDNAKDALKKTFRPKGCDVFSESVKVEIYQTRYYVYPDVVLTCHPFDKQSQYIIRQPSLIVEVLSKSTASDDRGDKWKACKKSPSLLYYVLVEQHIQSVEVYSRIEHTEVWTYQTFEKETDVIVFPRLNFELSVGAMYDGIDLSAPPEDVPSPD